MFIPGGGGGGGSKPGPLAAGRTGKPGGGESGAVLSGPPINGGGGESGAVPSGPPIKGGGGGGEAMAPWEGADNWPLDGGGSSGCIISMSRMRQDVGRMNSRDAVVVDALSDEQR